MQYALVNGVRSLPFPNGRGQCEVCSSQMISKCGSRKMHHWSHGRDRDCDPWWENETQWHRDWKALFPAHCREVVHKDENGEVHRSDIMTDTGIFIEVQHSGMSDKERESRERFYKNLIWIVDGKPFAQNFDIYHMLPDPTSEIAKDIMWAKARKDLHGANRGIFYRLSENPGLTKTNFIGGWVHSFNDIKDEIKKVHTGHYQYDWVRPRQAWLETQAPVFIDFGGDNIVQLLTYDESGLRCVRLISKTKVVYASMTAGNMSDFLSLL